MSDLASRECVPCRGGIPPLRGEELAPLAAQVAGWEIIEEHHLHKRFTFAGYRAAWDFINRVSQLAEAQGHHPDICFGWGYAEITIYTHKIDGLHESDFILAAKIDRLGAHL